MIRDAILEMSVTDMLQNERLIDDIIGYFSRQVDHTRIRSNIKTRYGLAIKHEKDPNNTTPDSYTETYGLVSDEAFEKQVDAGIIGAISIGFGQKVVGALATMFTEPGQKFVLTHDTIENPEEASELINEKRDYGGFKTALVEANQKAVQCGSSLVFVYMNSGRLTYQAVSPSCIRVIWPGDGTVVDRITGETRLADTTDIEDALAVIIKLGQIDMQTYRYLAICAKSESPGYENGRWVWFTGPNEMTNIPAVGAENVHDYVHPETGVVCNPLTYFSLQNEDLELPEYPLAVINGGITDEERLTPITTSLYEDCLEIDTAASHLLATSQDSARGTLIFTRTVEAASQPLPSCHTGAIALPAGMDARREDYDAACQEKAMSVLKEMMKSLAAGYSVPDYMVTSEDSNFDASSGIALQVKTRPLKKAREHMVDINRVAVRKIFDIEKAYIGMFFPEEPGAAQLLECRQAWDAGELRLPENRKEEAERIIMLKEKGILDEISAIQEYYKYATEQEAIAHYERMKERANEYPPLKQETQQPKPFGLKARARNANNEQAK